MAFLKRRPHSQPKSLWSLARSDLEKSYGRICAYTCRSIVGGSVDHFLPKSKYPELAYEWANYRLSCAFANQAKAAKVGLMDPFQIGLGWFSISFPQCDVVVGPKVPKEREGEAQLTIKALKLNSESLVEGRSDIAMEFRDGSVTLDYVKRHYPFLAVEIERQGSAFGASDEAGLRKFVASLFRSPLS